MTLSTIIELILIAVFALTVWNGYCRGLVRTVAGLLSVLGAALCGTCGTPILSSVLATKVFLPIVESAVAKEAAEAIADALDGLEASAGALFGAIRDGAAEYGFDIEGILGGITDGSIALPGNETIEDYASQIVTTVASPIAMRLAEITSFLLIFIVAYIVLRIVFRLLSALVHIPILHGTDKLLGLCAGILLGVAYMWIAANAATLVLCLMCAGGVLSYEEITAVSGPLYEFFTNGNGFVMPELPEITLPTGTKQSDSTL